jgi:hypothetical protein
MNKRASAQDYVSTKEYSEDKEKEEQEQRRKKRGEGEGG